MPVYVSCPRCGAANPSRMRARSESHFSDLNLLLGPALERCPTCGFLGCAQPADRAWKPERIIARPRSRR